MFAVSKKFSFSAAHRLEGHPKCGRMHGHNYVVEVLIEGTETNNGMVIDFAELDKITTLAVTGRVDHMYIVSKSNIVNNDRYWANSNLNDCVSLPIEHSSAECLAAWIAGEFTKMLRELGYDLTVLKVIGCRVWETEKCMAMWQDTPTGIDEAMRQMADMTQAIRDAQGAFEKAGAALLLDEASDMTADDVADVQANGGGRDG